MSIKPGDSVIVEMTHDGEALSLSGIVGRVSSPEVLNIGVNYEPLGPDQSLVSVLPVSHGGKVGWRLP